MQVETYHQIWYRQLKTKFQHFSVEINNIYWNICIQIQSISHLTVYFSHLKTCLLHWSQSVWAHSEHGRHWIHTSPGAECEYQSPQIKHFQSFFDALQTDFPFWGCVVFFVFVPAFLFMFSPFSLFLSCIIIFCFSGMLVRRQSMFLSASYFLPWTSFRKWSQQFWRHWCIRRWVNPTRTWNRLTVCRRQTRQGHVLLFLHVYLHHCYSHWRP